MEFHRPRLFPQTRNVCHGQRCIPCKKTSALLVPDMAVLRSGEEDHCFVALDGGKFDPRTVTLGPQAEGDMYLSPERPE